MNLLLLAWSSVIFCLYAEGLLDIAAVNVTAIVAIATTTAVTVTVTVVVVILTCRQHGDYSAATHRTFDAIRHTEHLMPSVIPSLSLSNSPIYCFYQLTFTFSFAHLFLTISTSLTTAPYQSLPFPHCYTCAFFLAFHMHLTISVTALSTSHPLHCTVLHCTVLHCRLSSLCVRRKDTTRWIS